MTQFAILWTEFDRNDRITSKTKEFKTEQAMQAYINKLEQKNNFNQIEAISR